MRFYFRTAEKYGLIQNVCNALSFMMDNIFMRFGTKLYRQVVEIPIGTYCAPLVADLSLFRYVKVTMMSLPDDKQADKTVTLS